MAQTSTSIEMIELVANALGDLINDVVFVGGATIGLYIDENEDYEERPTEDVDCIVEVASRAEYAELEAKLRARGFSHSQAKRAPLCRWTVGGVTVDVMPTDKDIIGFSNIWYKDGIQSAKTVTLPSGKDIQVFTLPYFIAAKLEAFEGRGQKDFRTSHDIEDVISLLDGQRGFKELEEAPDKVAKYLKGKFQQYLGNDLFLESVTAHISPGPKQADRVKRILEFLQSYF